MKKILIYIFFFEIIKLTYSIVPVWNLKKSGIDLFEKYKPNDIDYQTIDTALHDNFHFTLNVKLSKVGNIAKKENSLKFVYENEQYIIENAPWEDIESAYTNKNDKFYFCPRGKYHPYVYYKNSKTYEPLVPKDFIENPNVNWELKCYYQFKLGYIFVSYLNSDKPLYQLEVSSGNFIYNKSIEQGIYDYKWTTDPNNNNKYQMIAILKKNNNIYLKDLYFSINQNDNNFSYDENKEKKIIEELKSHYNIFFNNDNYNFYWINYNNNSDFASGVSLNGVIDINNIDNIEINTIFTSPIEFLDDVTIKQMNFMPNNNKYVYYEIYNNIKNITYHGIIDILLNKVIFNTDEEIKKFLPKSKFSMLALTKDSAYEICVVYGGYECIDKCYNIYDDKIFYDTQKPNLCFNKNLYLCENYILMPDEVCIEECDENIFTIINDNNKKQCGLCRDLNKTNPYKLINTKKCFSTPPEGTKIIDEKLKLINCSDGYTLKNDTCIVDKCNSHCKTCKGYSEDDNNQMCISCKNENEVVLNGNCIEKCPDRYFVKDNNCQECNDSCFSCSENPNNCTSCIDGEYLDESNHTCNNCTEHCKTCSKGLENGNENCLSCDLNSQYKYLVKAEGFDSNCVTGCPENTTLKKNECVGLKDDGKKKNDTLLYIFIIITAILLLLIIVCFFKNFCCRPKSHDEKLMKEINTELIESKNIVD